MKKSKPKNPNLPKDKKLDRPLWVCHFCGKAGHTHPNCFKLQAAKQANKQKVPSSTRSYRTYWWIGKGCKPSYQFWSCSSYNNSKTRVTFKRLWMQKAQSNWVFLTWSLCFISKSFVNFFSLMFLFSFAFRICIELHSCISYQVDFVCFSKNFKKINIKKKMERGMWKDVFCITYHGCVL